MWPSLLTRSSGLFSVCDVKPCSFNGVYQPSLIDTFPHGNILLLSYFYDRLNPFLATSAQPLAPPVYLHKISYLTISISICQKPARAAERTTLALQSDCG